MYKISIYGYAMFKKLVCQWVNTIRSPDDEHRDARNMWRHEINKYMKKCVNLVSSKNL